MGKIKSILIKIIDVIVHIKNAVVNIVLYLFDCVYKNIVKPIDVRSINETIDYIIETKCSISRYGDGEIKLVNGDDISFQKVTPFITEKLREVLSSNLDGHIVGIVDVFGDFQGYNKDAKDYWTKTHLPRYRRIWCKYTKKGKQYFNASITRPYIAFSDHSDCKEWFDKLKKIWDGRDIVFIEGEKSRLGVGNDLFDNATSIRRILAPSREAFSKYDEIFEEACKIEKSALILLALGPCATTLAYDLHKVGYWAVDMGHVDIEYEWFLMGTDKKVPVKNKMVFEAGAGESVGNINDMKYKSEIIAKIGDSDENK